MRVEALGFRVYGVGFTLKSRMRTGVLEAATSAAQASPATASSSSFRPLAGVRAFGVAALGVGGATSV